MEQLLAILMPTAVIAFMIYMAYGGAGPRQRVPMDELRRRVAADHKARQRAKVRK